MIIDAFVTGDYFIIFLVLVLAVLLVLVLLLIKSREEYNELLNAEIKRSDIINDNSTSDDNDLLDDLKDLMATSSDDVIDENKPLIKQVDLNNIETYKDKVNKYEILDEENAVISADELEKRAKERLDNLGSNENQEAIQKYEEEQEKKAIISYEQLLKNASNITLSYKEEKSKEKDAPKVNKIEVERKEVTGAELYIEEEQFLKILKEFRVSLE